MRRCFAIAVAAGISLTACKSDPGGEGASCSKKEDCAEGLNCLDGTCTKLEDGASASEPTGYCATLAALSGSWIFDTTVVGSRDLSSRGINGHFEMIVSVDNCQAKIALTKTGYDDVVFAKGKIQRADADLVASTLIPNAAEATVALKTKPTHTLTFVVHEDQLYGYYQYAEGEWMRAGIWGFLRGVKAGQKLESVEDFAVQPCEVRCLVQCDTPRRRADASLDEAKLAACMASCGGEAELPGCGPGAAMPEQLRVKLEGPAKTLDEVCGQASAALLARDGLGSGGADVRCDREIEVKDKRVARALTNKRLDGSFEAAQLLQVGYFDAGYTGHLVLALETAKGWFWTEPLVDVSMTGVGGVLLTNKSTTLRGRQLVSAKGREVVADITIDITDSDLGVNEVSLDSSETLVVCSVGKAEPICVRANTAWSSERTLIDDTDDDPKKHPDLKSESGELSLSFLPGDLVSLSTTSEGHAEDRALSGIYAWPGE